ncbi:MAG: NAD(P)H-dependent oxidoreductase subunit E [Anaerolineales bacterium]|nr:NAD(P)H-dependent oxidoreductase subunit E [Anaerolineales bacterium]
MKDKIANLLKQYDNDRSRLIDILLDIQEIYHQVPDEAVGILADQLDLSKVDVEQTISFYHFLTQTPIGEYAIYLNDSPGAYMYGRAEVAKAFEEEVGISFNSVTQDGLIGLWDTADIGMNDQDPAAIINGIVFTELDPAKVKKIIGEIKDGKKVEDIAENVADVIYTKGILRTMVKNHIHLNNPIPYDDQEVGSVLKQALDLTPEQIVSEIKESNLRGRGGAGFPTGLKWEFCRKSGGDEVYLICNADEGEPGTFKERVILTELPKMLFEGMAIAGYALDARQGIIYLRYEYRYLLAYLEDVLQEMRDQNLLGKNIAGKTGFDFDIRIQLGAGSYVCGEESGLIESMEGKRGEPRNRPPFPVESGYLNKPTVVNNVETLCRVVPIIQNGADWFKSIGTKESAGTKFLSISGDCNAPGVYQVEWGMTIKEMLKMVGATDVQAVKVGGPSGTCIDPTQFGRSIAFEDLATGGSMIIIGNKRDLLKDFILPFTNFFIEESCGSCAPCRSLTVILRDKLTRIIDGNGTQSDIAELYDWARLGQTANRCGLGQTAANPIITSIENFRNLYEDLVKTDEDYLSAFNMEQAVAESCEVVGRVPNIKSH